MNKDLFAVKLARVLLTATLLVPIILVPGVFFPYVTARTVFFRTLVELVMGIFLYLISTREYVARGRRDAFLWALVAFTVASVVAAVFSPAQNRSLFGDFERMGGVWAQLHFLMYYLLLRVFFEKKQWIRFFRLTAGLSALVSILAVAQYQSAYAGTIYAATNRSAVFATIGNTGLLGLYLFFGAGFAAYLAATANRAYERWIFAGIACLDLYGIILSQNRTSLLAIIVATVIGGVVYTVTAARRKRVVLGGAVLVVGVLGAALLFSQRAPNNPVVRHLPAVFNRMARTTMKDGDQLRLLQWRAAAAGFRNRPLVGYGPENFHLVWSANFQPELYGVASDDRMDRAHNAVLEVLSSTGLIGTIPFLAMWGALFFSLWRAGVQGRIPPGAFGVFSALFVGYMVCLVFWFFDINSVLPWLAACAFLWFLSTGERLVEFGEPKVPARRIRIMLASGGIVLVASLWLHSYETMRVARLLYRTQAVDRDLATTLHDYFKVFDSPAPQTTHTPILYGRFMGWIVPQLPPGRADAKTRHLVDTAFGRGITEMARERRRDPRNELVYTQQARLALLAASYYGLPEYYNIAIAVMDSAVALNPRRVQPRLVSAYMLMMGGRYDEARRRLLQAKAIYPKSGQIYYYIGHLYRLQRNFPAAAAAIDTAFAFGAIGQFDLYTAVDHGLEQAGLFETSARMLEGYLKVHGPRFHPDSAVLKDIPTGREDLRILARLPILWAQAGREPKMLAALNNFMLVFPDQRAGAMQFLRDFREGRLAEWARKGTLIPQFSQPAPARKDSARA